MIYDQATECNDGYRSLLSNILKLLNDFQGQPVKCLYNFYGHYQDWLVKVQEALDQQPTYIYSSSTDELKSLFTTFNDCLD